MSAEPDDTGDSVRRRRLRFRAWHRGMKEVDLILGSFADRHVATLTADELADFEALLEAPDQDIYAWIAGEKPVPPQFSSSLMTRLQSHEVPPRTRLER